MKMFGEKTPRPEFILALLYKKVNICAVFGSETDKKQEKILLLVILIRYTLVLVDLCYNAVTCVAHDIFFIRL